MATMRAGCSGWWPVSCSSEEGCSSNTGAAAMGQYRTGQVQRIETQVAVVGAGAAGLYTALCAARSGARVTLVSATPLAESSSYWAQGGLAAALASDDTPERHLADTVTAGRGLVRGSAVRI